MRPGLLPPDVQVDVTRNYGETASDKANELILHLLIATLSVTVLIGIFLGWREALVVLVAVPVTLALTLFVYYALGYSLNRITLFALIFSIGILVDDAIVVVENIYRHLQMGDRAPEVAAVEGVDEVGNPTILATLTVIAAILPMAFVSGLMGPYMRPIPVGASAAMLASLAVAFVITPYLALRLLRGHVAHSAPTPDKAHEPEETTRFARFYTGIMTPLMDHAPAPTGVLRRDRGPAPRVDGPHRRQAGRGQDAPLRQQVGVPGRARPAGGSHARDLECGGPGGGGLPPHRARSRQHRGVRRDGGAVQLQRPGPPLLPPPRRQRGRRAGQSPSQG